MHLHGQGTSCKRREVKLVRRPAASQHAKANCKLVWCSRQPAYRLQPCCHVSSLSSGCRCLGPFCPQVLLQQVDLVTHSLPGAHMESVGRGKRPYQKGRSQLTQQLEETGRFVLVWMLGGQSLPIIDVLKLPLGVPLALKPYRKKVS